MFKKQSYTITVLFFLLVSFSSYAKELNIECYKLVYNTDKQATFNAVITRVKEVKWKWKTGITTGIYLTVKIKKQLLIVPISPSYFLSGYKKLKAGIPIEIFGVKQKVSGRNIIIPKWIKYGNTEVYLRNYDGKGFWEYNENIKIKKDNRKGKRGNKGSGGRQGKGGMR